MPQTPLTWYQRLLSNRLFNIMLSIAGMAILALILVRTKKSGRKHPDFHEVEPAGDGQQTGDDSGASAGGRMELMDESHPGRVWYIGDGESVVIGRSASRSDIAFPEDKLLASRQMMITVENGSGVLTVLGTTETTYVQDLPISSSVELFEGDIIRAGNTRLRVRYD